MAWAAMNLTAERIRAALATCDGSVQSDGFIDISQARPAGVVLPIELAPEPRALFVLRSAHLKDHAGEVGFPGGKPEPFDVDLQATALRELSEEIGIGADDVEWCGHLTPRPVITGRYLIHPFVAVVREGARPTVLSPEIERVLSLPLLPLITGELPFYAVRDHPLRRWPYVPHFRLGAREPSVLYGASAYIFYELLLRLAQELSVVLADPILEDVPPWGDRYPQI
jgi:8-oxo-dGTP pyrophosphatase MutT (NUDIX family)